MASCGALEIIPWNDAGNAVYLIFWRLFLPEVLPRYHLTDLAYNWRLVGKHLWVRLPEGHTSTTRSRFALWSISARHAPLHAFNDLVHSSCQGVLAYSSYDKTRRISYCDGPS